MIFDPEKNDKDDFFDGPDIPETPPQPKKPVYSSDDPAYWDEDESQWEHLRPRSRWRSWLWLGLALAVVCLTLCAWLWLFSPCVDQTSQCGYVESAARKGSVFKTYEGVLIPYKEITDTSRTYTGDFVFSTTDRELFRSLRRAQRDGRPVRVEYKVFHAPLPWRGESAVIVTAVDSVDPATILPPR